MRRAVSDDEAKWEGSSQVLIQTRQYRCPEVLLESKCSTSADLWSFVCICIELASGDVLFDPSGRDNFGRDNKVYLFPQSGFN